MRRELNEFFILEEDDDSSLKNSNFMRFSPHHKFIWAFAERDNEVGAADDAADSFMELG